MCQRTPKCSQTMMSVAWFAYYGEFASFTFQFLLRCLKGIWGGRSRLEPSKIVIRRMSSRQFAFCNRNRLTLNRLAQLILKSSVKLIFLHDLCSDHCRQAICPPITYTSSDRLRRAVKYWRLLTAQPALNPRRRWHVVNLISIPPHSRAR